MTTLPHEPLSAPSLHVLCQFRCQWRGSHPTTPCNSHKWTHWLEETFSNWCRRKCTQTAKINTPNLRDMQLLTVKKYVHSYCSWAIYHELGKTFNSVTNAAWTVNLCTYSRVAPASGGYAILKMKKQPKVSASPARGVSTMHSTTRSTTTRNFLPVWNELPVKYQTQPCKNQQWKAENKRDKVEARKIHGIQKMSTNCWLMEICPLRINSFPINVCVTDWYLFSKNARFYHSCMNICGLHWTTYSQLMGINYVCTMTHAPSTLMSRYPIWLTLGVHRVRVFIEVAWSSVLWTKLHPAGDHSSVVAIGHIPN